MMRLTTSDMSYNWIVLMMNFKHKLLNQLIIISLMAKFYFDIPVSSPLNYVENSFHRIGRILVAILAAMVFTYCFTFTNTSAIESISPVLVESDTALSRRMRITGFRLIT